MSLTHPAAAQYRHAQSFAWLSRHSMICSPVVATIEYWNTIHGGSWFLYCGLMHLVDWGVHRPAQGSMDESNPTSEDLDVIHAMLHAAKTLTG